MKRKRLYSVKKFFMIASVALVFPFAILSVYFALHTIRVSEEMAASANRNALYLYQQELSTNLEQLEQSMAQSWAQDWKYQKLRFELDDIDAHESTRIILEAYKVTQSVYPCVGAMAIYSPANGLCRCIYDNSYSHDLREDIKKYVEETDFSRDSVEWYVRRIDDKWFMVRVLGLSNAYSVCFVDIDLGPKITVSEPMPSYLVYFDGNMEALNETEVFKNVDLDTKDSYYIRKIAGENFMIVHMPLGYGNITMAYIARYSGFGHMTISQMFAVTFTFLMLLLVPLVYYIVIRIFFRPLSEFIYSIHKSRDENMHPKLSYTGELVELNEFSDTFNDMMEEIEKLKIDSYEQEMAKQKAEFQYLQQQLKPHFYLNFLKTLYGIIQLRHTDKAQQMILGVSEYIRYTFRNNSVLVPLSEEIHQVENYVYIQQASIATRVILNVEIPDEAMNAYVPVMSIQTFVENSFKYAVCADRNLEIGISASIIQAESEVYLEIGIQDNGNGFPEDILDKYTGGRNQESVDGTSTGIHNIKQRLEIIYQSRAGITCMNNYQGALCELIIPLQTKQAPEDAQEVSDECIDRG